MTRCTTPKGGVRPHYACFAEWMHDTRDARIAQKRRQAEISFHRVGITFAVYGEESGGERLIPFDIAPRIIPAGEWKVLEAGLVQRVRALNMFLHDIYHDRRILEFGVIPESLVLRNSQYRPQMAGHRPAQRGLRAHRRHRHRARRRGRVLRAGGQPARALGRVLHAREPQDDDAPVPGAVRRPGGGAGRALSRRCCWRRCSRSGPEGLDEPVVAVLTPGSYNSAYFEHAFLAQQMGVELVEGQDLFVERRDGLHAHHARSAARARDLPPHRRRLPRSAGIPARFGARRARAVLRGGRGPRHPGQHLRHRRGRRQVDLPLRAGDDPLLPQRGSDPAQRADLPLRQDDDRQATCSTTWRNWWSRRPRAPAATAC